MTYITPAAKPPQPIRPVRPEPTPAEQAEHRRQVAHVLKDKDRDTYLSSREFGPGKRSQLEFKARDKNADGLLDRAESTAAPHEVAKGMDPDAGNELMDTNGDYFLTADEFGPGQENQARFGRFDRNADGVVTNGEYKAGLKDEESRDYMSYFETPENGYATPIAIPPMS